MQLRSRGRGHLPRGMHLPYVQHSRSVQLQPPICGDQACTFPGCTNPASCNYDPAAGCDDGSCTPDAVWWIPETLSGGALFTCEQPVGYTLADPACFNVILSTNPNCLVDWDAACQAEYCTCTGACGCTDATACNFNPQATFDDGSCILPDGCTNPAACNYDPAPPRRRHVRHRRQRPRRRAGLQRWLSAGREQNRNCRMRHLRQ